MNPFPDTIIVPTTANRLPMTEKNEAAMQKLLELEVDAGMFLMPVKEMPASNKWEIAREDLIDQLRKLPAEIRDKIFPPERKPLPVIPHLPVQPVYTEDDDDGGDDMMGGMSMGRRPRRPQDFPEMGR